MRPPIRSLGLLDPNFLATISRPLFPDSDADLWMDIQGIRTPAWPAENWTNSGNTVTLAANKAPNAGSIGGYWATATADNQSSIGVSGAGPGAYIYMQSNQFRFTKLHGFTTASLDSGPEKHYAARVFVGQIATLFSGMLLNAGGGVILSQMIETVTTATAQAAVGGLGSFTNSVKTVFWGWDANGLYIQMDAANATAALPAGNPANYRAVLTGIPGYPDPEPPNIRQDGEPALVYGFARTSLPKKAGFQAWFNAQFP